MKTELFIELVYKAKEMSSMFTLSDIVNEECGELDVRGVVHRGYLCIYHRFQELL